MHLLLSHWLGILFSPQIHRMSISHGLERKKDSIVPYSTSTEENYDSHSPPNTFPYSFPQPVKLRILGIFLQYLCCRESVRENTQRHEYNQKSTVQALGLRDSAQYLHCCFKKIFQIIDLEIYYLQIKLFSTILGIGVKRKVNGGLTNYTRKINIPHMQSCSQEIISLTDA